MSSLRIQDSGAEQPFTILRIDFQSASVVSEHPVGEGVDVVDHVQVRPESMVVVATITDSPFADQPQGGVTQAVRWLQQARGQLLDVVLDNEGVLQNYVIEAATHPMTVVSGRDFTMRLKQVRVARALSVLVPPSITTSVGAASGQSAGQQSASETEVPSSTLYKAGATVKAAVKALTGRGD